MKEPLAEIIQLEKGGAQTQAQIYLVPKFFPFPLAQAATRAASKLKIEEERQDRQTF